MAAGSEDASDKSALTPRRAGKMRVEEWQGQVGRMPGVTSSVVLPADDKCPPLLEFTHKPSGGYARNPVVKVLKFWGPRNWSWSVARYLFLERWRAAIHKFVIEA